MGRPNYEIAAVRRAARSTQGTLTRRAYDEWRTETEPSAPSSTTLTKRFGGWRNVVAACGEVAARGRRAATWADITDSMERFLVDAYTSGQPDVTRAGYSRWSASHRAVSGSVIADRYPNWGSLVDDVTSTSRRVLEAKRCYHAAIVDEIARKLDDLGT